VGGLQFRHRRDKVQGRPCGPLGIVFMSMRVAEINQHAVAHVFRDKPSVSLHGFSDAFLISRDELAQIFGVHARRQRRGAHEIAEHHGDLSALGSIARRTRNCHFGRRVDCCYPRECLDGFEKFDPRAEGKAELAQVIFRQIRQHRFVDGIFAKRALKTFET
jgi:hypothetical protein